MNFESGKKNEFQYKTATDIGILLLYCLCLWWWWWMLTNRIHHSTTHHWIIEKPNVNVCYTLRQKHKHNTQHMHCSAKLLNIRVNTLAIFFFLLAHAIHAVIHTTYTHTQYELFSTHVLLNNHKNCCCSCILGPMKMSQIFSHAHTYTHYIVLFFFCSWNKRQIDWLITGLINE